MNNVTSQLPKVASRNHGKKNALQNRKKKQTCICHFHERKKFVMKMKIKENVKLGASENANKRKKVNAKILTVLLVV